MVVEEVVGPVPADWEYATLGEACERGGGNIQTGPFGSQLHAADYVPNGIPSIMPQNIGENRVVENGIARVTLKDAQRLERYRVQPGDIVYSRRGDVEKRALISALQDGWLCGTGSLRVRFGKGPLLPRFAFYYMGDARVREWIVRHAHGATMPNLNTAILSALPFVIPPTEDQRAVAYLLGTLDDKIELNRRINETLDAITRAIFRSWFVDFDPVRAKAAGRDTGLPKALADLFPAALEDSDLGEIPRGWTAVPLYEVAIYINGAAYSAFEPNDLRRGLPIIKIAELKAGVTPQTKFSDVEMPEKYRIKPGEILFSWSGNPDTSIDTFVWSSGEAWLNQHIFRVLPRRPHERSFVLTLLRHLRPVFAEIARNKQTTGLGHITSADMKQLTVVVPDAAVMHAWNVKLAPILGQVFLNDRENHSLSLLRDTLLPKLVSGALRLSAVQGCGSKRS